MRISKAVITAASRKQRALPLQTLIDSDGVEKSVLAIIVEEVLRSGISSICVVVCPGDEAAYSGAAGPYAGAITFVQQVEPRGYGHAIACARDFCQDEPFLHLVGDHLYVSEGEQGCAEALVRMAEMQESSVSAVQPSHESLLPYYGCIGGHRLAGDRGLYEVEHVREKPTPTEAEQTLMIPGLRAGHYLCFFGMHVLTPTVLTILDELLAQAPADSALTLSDALDRLPGRERYLALESHGQRYDVGVKYGILTAQLALALNGQDRDEVLTRLLTLMIHREDARRVDV
jgi:UTP--glucose-1-phosphate uridylyltransferase